MILIHKLYSTLFFILPICMMKRLQLECFSYSTGFSLQAAAILLINQVHEITFLVVNGISYTILFLSVVIYKMTSKEPDDR